MELRVNILDTRSHELVEAVVRPARQEDKVLWSHWHGSLYRGADDGHWAWDDLIDQALADPDQFEVFTLEAASELQGLRMIQVAQDEVDDFGVHALRLSTAPWNRPPEVRYRGVGSLLVAVAVLRSLEDRRDGQVHCESLPDAEGFHRRNGMVVFDGLSSEGLPRYRFTGPTANRFLHRLRCKGLLPWNI